MGNQTEKQFKLSEGMLLAIVPAIAYGVAYCYESGFCSVFSIPVHFIQINLINILMALGCIVSGLLIVFQAMNLLYILLKPILFSTPIGRTLLSLLICPVFFSILCVFDYPSKNELIIFSFFFIWMCAVNLLLPVVAHREKATYREKLQAQEEHDQKIESLYDIYVQKTGLGGIFIFVACFLLVIAYAAGRGAAHRQSDFLTLSSDPHFVVLRQYSDQLIVGRLTSDTKFLLPEFRLITPTNSKIELAETLEWKRIGPLSTAFYPLDPTIQKNNISTTQPL